MKQCIFDDSDNFCVFTFFIDNIKRRNKKCFGEVHQVQKPEGISVNRDTNSDGRRRRNIKEGRNRNKELRGAGKEKR